MFASGAFHFPPDSSDESKIYDKFINLFNGAEDSLKKKDLWTFEMYSSAALDELDNIRVKLLFTRVNAYVRHGEFRKAGITAQALQETAYYNQGTAQLFHIFIKEKRYWDVIELCNTFKSTNVNKARFDCYLEATSLKKL